MVKVLRKKIAKIGTSNGVVIPAKFLAANRLKTGDQIAMIVNDNYVVIKSCDDPFFNDLLESEVALVQNLTKLRKQKVTEVRKLVKQAWKDLDEGKGEKQ
jgi:antitoxin component of MazEF toxin-antitoxin module